MSVSLLIWRLVVSAAAVVVLQGAGRRAWARLTVWVELRRWRKNAESIYRLPASMPIATVRELRETDAGLEVTMDLTDEALAAGVTVVDVERALSGWW